MNLPLRLSSYWFFATAALGVQFPYLTLYLKENVGLSASQAGMVLAVPPLVGVLAQPLWGQVADRTGSRARTLSILAFGASVGYVGLTWPESFAGMLVAVALLAFFSNGLIPTAVSVTMAGLADGPGVTGYGAIRVWGTVGFLLAVAGCPPLLHAYQRATGLASTAEGPSEPGLGMIFFLGASALCVASAIAWRLPSHGAMTAKSRRGDLAVLLSHGPYLRLMLFVFAAYLLLQGPMAMFPLFVRDRGGDMTNLSQMWMWMLLAEIPMVALAGRVFDRVGPRVMLVAAMVAAGVRWTVCAATRDMAVIYPVQALHALVIAGLIVGGAMYVDNVVPERLRSTGQAGMNLVGNGLGAILSSSLAGVALDHFGVDVVYAASGIGALAIGIVGIALLPRHGERPAEPLPAGGWETGR